MTKTFKDLENAFERIKNMDIIKENVTHVTNFLEQLSAEGIDRPRQIKYLYTLGKRAYQRFYAIFQHEKNSVLNQVILFYYVSMYPWKMNCSMQNPCINK